jgi:hypothetical protein
MNRDNFWRILDTVDRDALRNSAERKAVEPLIQKLVQMTEAEIIEFQRHLLRCLFDLDTRANFYASAGNLSDDSFLYVRCFVVGMGKQFYEQVVNDPSKMPEAADSFEWLLSAAAIAWSEATGYPEGNFEHFVSNAHSPETGSNSAGWNEIPGEIQFIEFKDSRAMIERLLLIDKRSSASIGIHHGHFGEAFCHQLSKSGFRGRGYKMVVLTLDPSVPHGTVVHVQSTDSVIDFAAGIDPQVYMRMIVQEQSALFINLAYSALTWLADRDGLDKEKLDNARVCVLDFAQQQACPDEPK